MSWKDTIVDGSTRVLATLGASEESTLYVKQRMGTLLDTVETRFVGDALRPAATAASYCWPRPPPRLLTRGLLRRITGVPQVKDVELLWFEAFKLKKTHDEASKHKFAQEAITRGVEFMPGDRFTLETDKLNKLKREEAEALARYNVAVEKATEAQGWWCCLVWAVSPRRLCALTQLGRQGGGREEKGLRAAGCKFLIAWRAREQISYAQPTAEHTPSWPCSAKSPSSRCSCSCCFSLLLVRLPPIAPTSVIGCSTATRGLACFKIACLAAPLAFPLPAMRCEASSSLTLTFARSLAAAKPACLGASWPTARAFVWETRHMMTL
jgi:hypothetical protein